jgi:hypothetical protein
MDTMGDALITLGEDGVGPKLESLRLENFTLSIAPIGFCGEDPERAVEIVGSALGDGLIAPAGTLTRLELLSTSFDAGGFKALVRAMRSPQSSLRNLTTMRLENMDGALDDPQVAGTLGKTLFLKGACPKLEGLYIGGDDMGDESLAALLKPLVRDFVDEGGNPVRPKRRRPLRALRLSGCGLGLPGLRALINAMEHGRNGVLSQLESLDIGHNPGLGDDGVTELVQRATVARTGPRAPSAGAVADWAGGIAELVLDHVGLTQQGPGVRALAQGLRDPGIFPRLRELWVQRSQYCFAINSTDYALLMDAAAEGRAAGTRTQALDVPGEDGFENPKRRPRWGWEAD